MKKPNIMSTAVVGAIVAIVGFAGASVQAAEPTANRDNVEKYEKEIAKHQADVSKKVADIKTQQIKIDKDVTQYGHTSDEVKSDQDKLKDLRKDLADKKVDLFKSTIMKKVEAGEPIEAAPVC